MPAITRSEVATKGSQQPTQTVDFAFTDKEAGVAFVGAGDWEIKVDSSGIRIQRKSSENSKESPTVHHVQFGQIRPGKIVLNAVEGSALRHAIDDDSSNYVDDHSVKVQKIEKKNKNLKKSLRDEKYEAEYWKGKAHEFLEIVAPISRRALLEKARQFILRDYYTQTRPEVDQMVRDHIKNGGHIDDRKLCQQIQNYFNKDYRDIGPDALYQDIIDVVSEILPNLTIGIIKTVCDQDDEIRQAGNEAAHRLVFDHVGRSLQVHTAGINLDAFKSVFSWYFDHVHDLESTSSS